MLWAYITRKLKNELMSKNNQKLTTNLKFNFEQQEDMPELIVNMKLKTRNKSKDIKIIKNKRKVTDPSTKLF